MRNINEEETQDTQLETKEKINPESTCYIREIMEEWQNLNFKQSVKFRDEKVTEIQKTNRGDFWIQIKQIANKVVWVGFDIVDRALRKWGMLIVIENRQLTLNTLFSFKNDYQRIRKLRKKLRHVTEKKDFNLKNLQLKKSRKSVRQLHKKLENRLLYKTFNRSKNSNSFKYSISSYEN